MQDDRWVQNSTIFDYSKHSAWRWRWTFAVMFAGIALFFHDGDAGIVVKILTMIALFLVVYGINVFFHSAKLISVSSQGLNLYDSAFKKDNPFFLAWNKMESISVIKQPLSTQNVPESTVTSSDEPSSLFIKLTVNPFPKEFYPTNFSWNADTLTINLYTEPKKGFRPLLRLIKQYRSSLLHLHGWVLNDAQESSVFGFLFGFFYDIALFVLVLGTCLIMAFYQFFETDDGLYKFKHINQQELIRLQQEIKRRFFSGEVDLSPLPERQSQTKTKIQPQLQPKKEKAKETLKQIFSTEVIDKESEGYDKRLLLRSDFQQAPDLKPVFLSKYLIPNLQFSWSNEYAYQNTHSLKIKLPSNINTYDESLGGWFHILKHQEGAGYLLESYVLASENTGAVISIDTLNEAGKLLLKSETYCIKDLKQGSWNFVKHQLMATDITGDVSYIRFGLSVCLLKTKTTTKKTLTEGGGGDDELKTDSQGNALYPNTLYYDMVSIYSLNAKPQ